MADTESRNHDDAQQSLDRQAAKAKLPEAATSAASATQDSAILPDRDTPSGVSLKGIDQLRRRPQHLVNARDFAGSVVESVPAPIVVLNDDCTIRTVNTAFRRLTELGARDLADRSLPDLVKFLWGVEGLREKLENLVRSQTGTPVEFEHESTTSIRKTLLFKAQALSANGHRVLLMMMEDITPHRDAERLIARQMQALESEIQITARNLTRTQEELRGLTAHLFTVQEQERQHLARELHDDISQRLSLLEMLLEQACLVGKQNDRKELETARAQVHSLNNDIRQISHRLHPAILQDLGLSAALNAMVREFGEREGMPATYVNQDLPHGLSREVETAVYRIAQEALHNVAKHAGKTHVRVLLEGTSDKLRLRVMDFGVGFDQQAGASARGLGMISMQERARLAGGTFDVKSHIGQGTTIDVEIPLEDHA